MVNIIIVGAGGLGREIFGYVQDCISSGKPWKIKGFIDDNPNALQGYKYETKIISSMENYLPSPDDTLVCAIGTPKIKKEKVEKLLERGAKFTTLVHPTAYVGPNVVLGEGAVICPRVSLTCDISIGKFALLNIATGCGHDSQIGDFATISGFCDITGFCKVGEGAFLASHVSMIPNSEIGKWSKVGIGSTVILKIKDNESAFGNPAVPLRLRK
ncbi:sugar O-acyltransferase sialic acid O-acetyltransferase NeuD family [Coraliomargarita sp. CAG:312]|nr:sugar O-acyltransferase sialic acid O-acetyltransferase NeuD family [Coraliomargarita sp. CAG:312]